MQLSERIATIRENKHSVLVVGLGISGVETARALQRLGIQPICVERMSESDFTQRSKQAADVAHLKADSVQCHFGIDGERIAGLLSGVGMAVISPGVPLESAICGALTRNKIEFISELEFGVEMLGLPSIVVTGSNGKSTTVTLISALLSGGDIPNTLCGNIGVPVVCDVANPSAVHESARVLVVEASSYQLEACTVLKPSIAVLLNISENHLERHGTIDRYFAAKCRAFSLQDRNDFAVLNSDDAIVARLLGSVSGNCVPFGCNREVLLKHARAGWWGLIECAPSREVDRVVISTPSGNEEIFELAGCNLIGIHNRYDIAAALLAARIKGVTYDQAVRALVKFKPLTHRLEFIEFGSQDVQSRNMTIINDSKSTTVAATVAAVRTVLEFFPDRKIRLMIGGLSKAGSWRSLIELLSANQSRFAPIVCFGRDAGLLYSHCQAAGVPSEQCAGMVATTQNLLTQVSSEEVVLLSPGCASFDEFSDFEHRGDVFKSVVSAFFTNSRPDEQHSTIAP